MLKKVFLFISLLALSNNNSAFFAVGGASKLTSQPKNLPLASRNIFNNFYTFITHDVKRFFIDNSLAVAAGVSALEMHFLLEELLKESAVVKYPLSVIVNIFLITRICGGKHWKPTSQQWVVSLLTMAAYYTYKKCYKKRTSKGEGQ